MRARARGAVEVEVDDLVHRDAVGDQLVARGDDVLDDDV
jgi:hypothetical protein